ncbi:tRNA uridine(34) 5-carboxymethylaminomethyl modification radical SAM/GNAT enzyme Elp3, partial [Halobacteriales archaeon SW_7_68_16]
MSEAATGEAFERACEELVQSILDGEIGRDDVEAAKREVCSKYAAPKVPKNSELLDRAPDGRREELESVVRRKPVRTASGVSPVAVMTSPHRCPHGKCLYCPGGPDSEFSSAQSYTGHEPAAARGVQNDYDPYGQVILRLNQLREIGHPVDKVELILMGGTMTARSHDYQEWFVKRALQAMNEFDPDAEPEPAEGVSFAQDPGEYEFRYLEDVIATNETAAVRNIGTTFETKPDWCDPEQIDRMLRLGGTKVEVGVQTTYENREMHRGHGVRASIDANRRLRDAGFKIGFHMMPGQPGMSREMCIEDFRRLFERPEWRPDYLKIYPTLIVEGTATYDWWHRGEFDPLSTDEAADIVAEVKQLVPEYTRIQRVQRDIPADFIEAGVRKSNLRQIARQRMHERGGTCSCIRCREVGMNDETPDPDAIELDVRTYEAGGGTEQFLAYEDTEHDLLIGFCRLRYPDDPTRPELTDAALVRELHVYGPMVSVGDESADWQHRGYGRRLLREAERRAADAGYDKLAVISGIGAREYYREKLGYRLNGPYVS